jgi:2-polyprenyl-6-methoxyphenol hydroxylase-like FAD-dependent oxidoreductase
MPEDVVIAGAGPNGLMLACELALGGVTPIVLDPLPGPSDEPKANGLVGQVIRQLDMRGLYQTISGQIQPPEPSAGWIFAGMTLDFTALQGNPMHALLVPQPRLVRRLEKRARELGVDVRWGHELVDLSPGADGVTLSVASPDGDHTLDAAWLVGADGGRSTVRKRMGIGFPGSTAPTIARLAHVRLPESMVTPDGGLDIPGFGRIPFGHNRFDTGCVIVAMFDPAQPLLGTLEYGWTPGSATDPMSLDDLRRSLQRILGVDVPVEAPAGPGPHALRRIEGQNTRQAERYRAGRVLLAGDAAHVHSAMGGPGLNLGLQDVVNLGWKLAAVINGRAPEALLDTYESERYPVGERVMMQSQAQMALMAPGPEIAALRTLFGELVAKPDVTGHLAHLLAGSDVRYDMGEGSDGHPLTGRLVPDLTLDDGRRVAELLRAARPVLLDLTGTLSVTPEGCNVVTGTMSDAPAAALFLRPDGYVAWAADTVGPSDIAALGRALQRWCGRQLAMPSA